MLKRIVVLLIIISSSIFSFSQPVDSISYRLNSRFSFYSFEKRGELLLHVPLKLINNHTEVSLTSGGGVLVTWQGIPGMTILRIPFEMSPDPGNHKITAYIIVSGRSTKYFAATDLMVLEYKPNEVKTDRLTGGLIVNRRQFFPFGFYCYSPVSPTLPEEEAVRGFNLISPYQRILPETFNERKAYMDRCAELGMKVNYNLLSVSVGGGVWTNPDSLRRKEQLINEVMAFRDHPALLSWYIADEPNGHRISPEVLEDIYQTVKKHDPWHPVTIVFMAPHKEALKYTDALDIVMADSYPIPDLPVTVFGNVASQLANDFRGYKPLWMVPQSFGGGEIWKREPTQQEIRSMTYQAIINGARGIQYFIRDGLNLFPKSTSAWGECGRMAVEIAVLTPWLLSDEETIPVSSGNRDILVTSSIHDGSLMIMAVNKTNSYQKAEFKISGRLSGVARVIFENRTVRVVAGGITDQLPPFGSHVYIIDRDRKNDSLISFTGNMLPDPGFEDITNTGVPASCYARNGGDRGATYFLDSREHVEGNNSVRMITPQDNESVKLRFFPVPVMPGQKYLISVRAKADPEQRPLSQTGKPQYFQLSMNGYGNKSFKLTDYWKEFVTIVTIPMEEDLPGKVNVILQMPSAGVAWFDMLQVIECVDIKRSINPELLWDIF